VLIVAICERVNPQHDFWNVSQGDVGTDVLHGLVSQVAIPKLLEIALQALLLTVAVRLTHFLGFALWPSTWPIFAQLALALVVSQFGEYWLHRSMHERPLLWRLHATHHSPGRLYWLNAARFHPLDTAASFSITMTPLLLLGASADVMLLLTAWIAVHGLFQHCNVRLRLGPLNYIFSMAELHRWHHSLKLHEANTNYGNNIIFWDIVFGTMFHPKDREAARQVGLSEMPDFPQHYLGQLLSPIRWRQIESRSQAPQNSREET
jgi:sterol desaturase/sphingolipid hydroxylase (fatty acid hydroxylase superfamily)